MKRIIITLITILSVLPALAQKNTEYTEMAGEVDNEVWADKDPIFTNNKLPVEFKNESAVILARKQIFETNTERKGKSLLYIGKMHSTIKKTIRERIYINDQVSLNAYSEINFNQLQSKQSGAITKLRTYTFMGIRVTKADGSLQKINVDEAAVKIDETKDSKKNKIAVPNLAIGDIIDYYITYFDQARTDKGIDYLNFVLGDEYPIVNLSISVLLDKRIAAQYQAVNGAPDFKVSDADGEKKLDLTAGNLPKSTSVIWTAENRQVPMIRMKYAFADIVHGRGDYTRIGTLEKITSPEDVEHEFINIIKPYLSQLTVYTEIKSDWKDYAKAHNISKENLDSIISFVYYFNRYKTFAPLVRDNTISTGYDRFYDCGMELSTIKQLELTLKILKTVNTLFDAKADLVLISGKNEVEYKDVFSLGDINFLLRVANEESKFSFYYFGSNLYNFDEIPASFENETYKFIQQNTIFRKGADMSQKKADMTNGNAVAAKTSAADNNQTEELEIAFDNADLQLLNINRRVTASGHQRRSMQNATLILEDYWIAERRLLGKETDIKKEWTTGERFYRKFWTDAEQSMTKAKKDQKEKFEKEADNQYKNKPKAFNSFKIIQDGFSGTKASIIIEEDFTMDGWVKKAGNNYIIEAGKLVGSQLEIMADQRERKLDIYMPYARSFNNKILLKIPEGYTVEGVENLNKSVKNECGGFESTAKIEGNNLLITYYKYYSNLVDAVVNWPKIVAFVDAGFAFTKEKILLKKK